MRSLDKQFLTFYAAIGSVTPDSPDGEIEQAYKIKDKAWELVEKRERSIPGAVVMEHEIECTAFELCENDAEAEEDAGRLVFGIGFVANQNLPVDTVAAMRDVVVQAFEEAGKAAGVPVSFAYAERQNVLRVTETAKVDFTVPTPDCE